MLQCLHKARTGELWILDEVQQQWNILQQTMIYQQVQGLFLFIFLGFQFHMQKKMQTAWLEPGTFFQSVLKNILLMFDWYKPLNAAGPSLVAVWRIE